MRQSTMSNERIHAWLDGDLPLDALSAEERAAAGELGAAVAAASHRASQRLCVSA